MRAWVGGEQRCLATAMPYAHPFDDAQNMIVVGDGIFHAAQTNQSHAIAEEMPASSVVESPYPLSTAQYAEIAVVDHDIGREDEIDAARHRPIRIAVTQA